MVLLDLAAACPAIAAPGTPKPELLVLNKVEATMVIVDPASGMVVGTVATGEGPHEVGATAGAHPRADHLATGKYALAMATDAAGLFPSHRAWNLPGGLFGPCRRRSQG